MAVQYEMESYTNLYVLIQHLKAAGYSGTFCVQTIACDSDNVISVRQRQTQ